ncbi:hypothetical protein [Streptomyces sp. AP-93]|uniref:hypothetical protein n=1 Tax=Streptomyces sp. AP-93 TaxID=2929048 RepID=UPI001FAFC4C0|nr:hypothetical protein [Streptomyces sp. AP-93]MCJ0868434.1 hypothetical protein [Streptomyces sp. AP-93]
MTPPALHSLGHWNATSLAGIALALACSALLIRRLTKQGTHRNGGSRKTRSPAVTIAALAAVGCTAYSADTSWRFAANYLAMGSTVERAFMFATAELALFATALMARQNLNGPTRAPGVPGVLVWVITAVQIIPAYAEFGLVGGTVRAFVGPVMAAMLWHLAMGIELRHRTPQAASHSLAAVLVRQARERILARLGIADQDADAARLIRERALSKAVTLILRAATMTDQQHGKRRGRRLADRLHQALERADVDGDPLQDELLLRKLATRKQALALASLTLPPRWHPPTPHPARDFGPSRPPVASPGEQKARRHTHPSQPSDAGSEDAHQAARPQTAPRAADTPRPQPARAATGPPSRAESGVRPPDGSPPPTGLTSGSAPGRRTRKRAPGKGQEDRKPRATEEAILGFTRRLYEETGSVSRDRVENAVRAAGYTVASDDVGRIVRTFKNQPKAPFPAAPSIPTPDSEAASLP